MQISCSYTVNTVHILNIPGLVKCPRARNKLTVKCPGAGNFICANARGCPGGMVRVGIECDITLQGPNLKHIHQTLGYKLNVHVVDYHDFISL